MAAPLSPKVVSEVEKLEIDHDLNQAVTLSQHAITETLASTNGVKMSHKKTASQTSDIYPARNSSL